MAWRIHRWSAKTSTGSVVSPHYGPLPFSEAANVDGVRDFAEGESVVVELDGQPPELVVRTVRPSHARQPPETRWAAADGLRGRFLDLRLEGSEGDSLRFWYGDCCDYCSPDAVLLTFSGVTATVGLEHFEDGDIDNPLFRLASTSEVEGHALAVPDGAAVYCIVTSHGAGLDGPPVFIVARAAEVRP